MKKSTLLVSLVFIIIFLFWVYNSFLVNEVPREGLPRVPEEESSLTGAEELPKENTPLPEQEVVVENLTIPWGIAFLPDSDLLITERSGSLVRFDKEKGTTQVIEIDGVKHSGEGGLLGMVLHPRFNENQYLYLYLTSTQGDESVNKVVRYRYVNDMLTDEFALIEDIPGALFHNGGRMAFGPDGYLYIATGDARDPNSAQDRDSLAGKILRVTDEGVIPSDNPFNSEVYSYGHRNPQGLAWDDEGRLWSTEHGRSGVRSGLDEVNLIEKGGNYGWPDSEGDTVLPGTIGPALHSTTNITWAPASATFVNGGVFFGGLRGETLYEAVLSGDKVVELKEHFVKEFGRIRTTVLGPNGALYITTSNRDGRGAVQNGDDKVIQLDPEKLK